MKKIMSIVILIVGVGLVFCSLAEKANADMKFQDWLGVVTTDKMTGKKTSYIMTMSLNILNGWLRNGHLTLAYNGKTFVVLANNLGLKKDYGGNQYVRMKIDDSNPSNWNFHIYEDNDDGMFLAGSSKGSIDDLFESMKAGNILYVEVSLFNTKGQEQIAKFSLMGFTDALRWVKNQ